MKKIIFFALLGALLLSACSLPGTTTPEKKPGIEVRRSYSNALVASGSTEHVPTYNDKYPVYIEFIINNTGEKDLVLSGSPRVVLSGADSSLISVSVEPDETITAGGSTAFRLLYIPRWIQDKSVVVSIASNCKNTPNYSFTVALDMNISPVIVHEGTDRWNSMVTDSENNPHISYASTIGDLTYGTGNMSAWDTSIVDDDTSENQFNAIAVDSEDNLHIAYFDYSYVAPGVSGSINYATNSSGSWEHEVVYGLNNMSFAGSLRIAVDSEDNIYIVFWDQNNGYDIKIAENSSGSWNITSFDDPDAMEVSHFDAAIDSNDNLHILYFDWDTYEVKHAAGTPGDWSCETIDTLTQSDYNFGYFPCIAIGAGNVVHLLYRKSGIINYCENSTGVWTHSEVTNDSWYPSLAVDSNNNAYIAAYGIGSVVFNTNVSGEWRSEQFPGSMDAMGTSWKYISICVGKNDKVHLLYHADHSLLPSNPSYYISFYY